MKLLSLRLAFPLLASAALAACGNVIVDTTPDPSDDPDVPAAEPEPCPPGEQEACYSGPAGTLDIGACSAGVRVCPSDGKGWTECIGEVLPAAEVCSTGKDENCDGIPKCTGEALWARDMESSPGFAAAHDVTADPWGNVLVTGNFEEHADLAGLTLDGPEGGAFVFKLNSSGEGVWARQVAGGAYGTAIGSDAEGNVLVAGGFHGAVELEGEVLESDGYANLFFAKYDRSGELLWSRKLGGSGYQWAEEMAVDAEGNMLVIGGLHDGADLGDGYQPAVGETDVFVVKISPSGERLWSRRFGSKGYDHGLGIAALADGSTVITGSFEGTLDLGGGPLVTAGSDDIFLAQLSPGGKHVWSRRFGGANHDLGKGIAVGPTGTVVVAGLISGKVDLGTGPVSAGGSYDAFVSFYGSDGEPLGAQVGGGPGATAQALDVAVDGAHNVIVWGMLTGTATFGGAALTAASTGTGASEDVFVVKYDPAGQVVHGRVFGDQEQQLSTGIAVDATGHVLLAGYFRGTIDFGTGPLASPDTATSDLFVARTLP